MSLNLNGIVNLQWLHVDHWKWKLPKEYLKTFDNSPLLATLEVEMDVDVSFGDPSSGPRARLVNVRTPEGWRDDLTNVLRDMHDAAAIAFPRPIAG